MTVRRQNGCSPDHVNLTVVQEPRATGVVSMPVVLRAAAGHAVTIDQLIIVLRDPRPQTSDLFVDSVLAPQNQPAAFYLRKQPVGFG